MGEIFKMKGGFSLKNHEREVENWEFFADLRI